MKSTINHPILPLVLLIFALFGVLLTNAQDNLKVLLVTAHPDDETMMAATIYKITHELHGIVDQVVISNGEGGYRYSLLAEDLYKLKLTDEKIGREYLPRIRKQELLNAGKIIGIRNNYFLDQRDAHFGLDAKEPLDTTWNASWVETQIKYLITSNNYDYIFCLLPDSLTHAHHKAATIIALRAINQFEQKPVILAVSNSNMVDSLNENFYGLEDYPLTKIKEGKFLFQVDRRKSFGFRNKLTYKIIVNWEIAEHKSQGAMQTYMNDGDFENFWYFDINTLDSIKKTKDFFDALNNGSPI